MSLWNGLPDHDAVGCRPLFGRSKASAPSFAKTGRNIAFRLGRVGGSSLSRGFEEPVVRLTARRQALTRPAGAHKVGNYRASRPRVSSYPVDFQFLGMLTSISYFFLLATCPSRVAWIYKYLTRSDRRRRRRCS